HGDVLMWLMKTLLTSGCTNQRGAGQRQQFDGKPHQSKPDFDNLVKALSDAIYEDDAHIWDARITKLWGEVGQIIIRNID
ncbi:RusA family crossover junction endodeoxyribonuclease, partial [Enterobacter hormaechei subsp. xiangfangensis]